MAGVKGNKGGKRARSGRKSRAEELGLAALIDSRLDPEKWGNVVDKLYDLAIGDNPKAAVSASSLLLGYKFGKPTEKHEHGGENGGPIMVKVVYETA